MRFAVEEKGLADHRLQTFGFEGFGDEKGGFWRRPRQKTLGISGNENHRHGKGFENLIDRFKTRASIGELNVGEDEAWLFPLDGIDRLAMGPRDIGDAVPLLFDEVLKIKRNEGLILDDQDIGANLVGDLLAGGVNEIGRLVSRAIEGARDFRGIEALERAEKKGNPGAQGNRFEVALRARFVTGECCRIDMSIDGHRTPDLEEQAVKCNFGIGAFGELGWIRDNGFERGENIGVAPGLGSRQSP